MSPDVFLSQHGIRYDGLGVSGTPAEIVAHLKTLNATRKIGDDGKLKDEVYRTVGFAPAPFGPNSFNPATIASERKAIQAYQAALSSGDLNVVHGAVDDINAVRAVKGGSEFVPQSDFDILAHANSELGQMARYIASERLWVEETGFGSTSGSVLPWFDTVEAFHELEAL